MSTRYLQYTTSEPLTVGSDGEAMSANTDGTTSLLGTIGIVGGVVGALLLCVLHEDPSWFLAWLYVYLFLLVVVVLLLNMLIAMFSRTFEIIWESQSQSHQFMFARTVVAWCTTSPEPPPPPAPVGASRFLRND